MLVAARIGDVQLALQTLHHRCKCNGYEVMFNNNALFPLAPVVPDGPAASNRSRPTTGKRDRLARQLQSSRVALGVALVAGGMAYAATAAFVEPAGMAVADNAAQRWGPAAAALAALALSYMAAMRMRRLTPAPSFVLIWTNLVLSAVICAAPLAALMPAFPWQPWMAALLAGMGWHALSDALLRRLDPLRIGITRRSHDRLSVNGLAMKREPVAPGAALHGRMIVDASAYRQWMSGRVPVSDISMVGGMSTPSRGYLAARRLLDVSLALVLLVPVTLVIAVAAVLIRLDSPGPAIFRQRRVGYRQRPFTCYKLRSMRTDIHGGAFTDSNDRRITAIGHVIRKFRINELPQIFNILLGDMSWIGPRPESVELAARYRLNIPGYSYRYLVPPGITGWAAVHQGNVGDIDAAQTKLEYDFYYIRHVSPIMDLLVAFKTVRVILTGFGSRS